jgi:MATE family multidrug resistance protein
MIRGLRRTTWLTAVWGGAMCLALAVAFLLAGPSLIALMAKNADVQAEANALLVFLVAAPIAGTAAWMLDGVFIGAARGADMRDSTAISFVIYAISAVVLTNIYGNEGLWMALLISFVARGVTLGMRYPALERSLLHSQR